MKPDLLILAAGIGSRYGGVKQMDGIGPGGESIIDYSVYDAIRAGFGRIIFVINKQIEKEFREVWEPKLEGAADYAFVIQDISDIPDGYKVPDSRLKPWGTGHAILAARNEIKSPFAVINADDFYGYDAYVQIVDFLRSFTDNISCCLVGYKLKNTLSEYGTVSRGVCEYNESQMLKMIREVTSIELRGNDIGCEKPSGSFETFDGNSLISMNIWGFQPLIIKHLEKGFKDFLDNKIHIPNSEYLLPEVVNELIGNKIVNVRMLETEFRWFGVTYKKDKELAVEKINEMINRGDYPSRLWKQI